MTDKSRRKRTTVSRGQESVYEKRVVSDEEADRRAWAIVNKPDQSIKKSGSGRKSRPKHGHNEER